MNTLILSGTSNTGKSETLGRLVISLLNSGFNPIYNDGPIPTGGPVISPYPDFLIILERVSNKETQRILVNSPSDFVGNIDKLKNVYDQYFPTIDILITSLRDSTSTVRSSFFKQFNLNNQSLSLIEIPLAKFSGKRADFIPALDNYRIIIDRLILWTLERPPFNI